MARPRKPTALHALTGSIDHDPGRFRDRMNEPQTNDPLGPPLETMRPDQRAAWMEIGRLAPWLTFSDRIAVEIASCLLAMVRIVGVGASSSAHLTRLESMLGRLGLTPSDRSRINASHMQKPGNQFDSNRFAGIGKRPA